LIYESETGFGFGETCRVTSLLFTMDYIAIRCTLYILWYAP